MEQLYPEYRTMEPEEIYHDLHFPELPESRPYLALNMVTSVDGKATLLGKAYPLGTRTDHIAMRRIRAAADAVMNGAETLRQEKVNPRVPERFEADRAAKGMTPQPAAIVLTATADLPMENPFFTASGFTRLVATTLAAPAERVRLIREVATVIQAGEETIDLPALMATLVREYGIRRLVCEGGPSTNARLIASGLVDELFWTVAPKVLGGAAHRSLVEGGAFPVDSIPNLRLVSVHEHESELFLRYRFPGQSGATP